MGKSAKLGILNRFFLMKKACPLFRGQVLMEPGSVADASAAVPSLPSTIGCNWRWRAVKEQLSKELAREIRTMTLRYGRMNWENA